MLTINRTYANGSNYEGKPRDYYCLSADEKPGVLDNLVNGSTLYVMDTKELYLWG